MQIWELFFAHFIHAIMPTSCLDCDALKCGSYYLLIPKHPHAEVLVLGIPSSDFSSKVISNENHIPLSSLRASL